MSYGDSDSLPSKAAAERPAEELLVAEPNRLYGREPLRVQGRANLAFRTSRNSGLRRPRDLS